MHEVARDKAEQAFRKLGRPLIVEDTGLHIKSMKGFPGPMVKWLIQAVGYERLCRLCDSSRERSAYAETCVALHDGKRVHLFSGRISGRIAKHPRGRSDFGWDLVFIPEGHSKTFAEMSMEEKSRISMRRKAFMKLRGHLERAK